MARSNVEALGATLGALRESGELDEVPAALVTLVESLAQAVDDGVLVDGKRTDASAPLWREYRTALAALLAAAAGGEDDDTGAFLVSIRTPSLRAKVGDSTQP